MQEPGIYHESKGRRAQDAGCALARPLSRLEQDQRLPEDDAPAPPPGSGRMERSLIHRVGSWG